MSCLICNELLHHMCESCNKSKPSLPSWHELVTQVYLWTNHRCISHLNTLVHLGCHSITKTKQGPFRWPAVARVLAVSGLCVVALSGLHLVVDNPCMWPHAAPWPMVDDFVLTWPHAYASGWRYSSGARGQMTVMAGTGEPMAVLATP